MGQIKSVFLSSKSLFSLKCFSQLYYLFWALRYSSAPFSKGLIDAD